MIHVLQDWSQYGSRLHVVCTRIDRVIPLALSNSQFVFPHICLGILTQLMYPYPRDVMEPSLYESVRLHTEFGEQAAAAAGIEEDRAMKNSRLSVRQKILS